MAPFRRTMMVRTTLEPLLLAPASRRQIVFGKLLAALSPWPVALLLSVPYVFVLSEGDDILGLGLVWMAMLGSLLAVAFAGFGMLVSMWSRSNRTSLFVSLFVYLLFLIPTRSLDRHRRVRSATRFNRSTRCRPAANSSRN